MGPRGPARAGLKDIPMSNNARKTEFSELSQHKKRIAKTTMREMFADDPARYSTFSARFGDILLDYSKNRVYAPAMDALFDLARVPGVEEKRVAMWAGEAIN